MPTSIEPNAQLVEAHLTAHFGADPKHWILVQYQKPSTDPARAAQNKKDLKTCWYQTPHEVVTSSDFNLYAGSNNMYYDTAPVFGSGLHNSDQNLAELNCLYVDFDAGPKLGDPTNGFRGEVIQKWKPSYVVSTSEGKFQAVWKLPAKEFDPADGVSAVGKISYDEQEDDEDFELALGRQEAEAVRNREAGHGKTVDKESKKSKFFKGEYKELISKLCYAIGADHHARNPSRLLRVAGSLNIKYNPPQFVDSRCLDWENPPVTDWETMKQQLLRVNQHYVPDGIAYLIIKQMLKVTSEGDRTYALLMLTGSVKVGGKLGGMDEETCRNLLEIVIPAIGGNQDAADMSRRTYEKEHPATLYSSFEGKSVPKDVADMVGEIMDYWIDAKTQFCNSMGYDWKPLKNVLMVEDTDTWRVTASTGYTQYGGERTKSGDPAWKNILNASLEPVHYILKAMPGGRVTRVVRYKLVFQGCESYHELRSADLTEFNRLASLEEMPTGLSCENRSIWPLFVSRLAELSRNLPTLVEVPYEGYHDIDSRSKPPTLVLAGVEHPEYIVSAEISTNRDTTCTYRHVTPQENKDYLEGLVRSLPYCNERYVTLTVLGFFAASVFTGFMRSRRGFGGSPMLYVHGVQNSGKTDIVNMFAYHFGAKYLDSEKTSLSAMAALMDSNNHIAMVMDETKPNDDEYKGKRGFIKGVWNGSGKIIRDVGGRRGSKAVVELAIRNTLVLLGENVWEDDNAMDSRANILKMTDKWLRSTIPTMEREDPDAYKAQQEARKWMLDPDRGGMMLSLILDEFQGKSEELYSIMEASLEFIAERLPNKQGARNLAPLAAIIFGIQIIRNICKKFGVKFPYTIKDLYDIITTENPSITNINQDKNFVPMQGIIRCADNVILRANLGEKSIQNKAYFIDPANRDYCYWDMNKLYSLIKPEIKANMAHAAALKSYQSFVDILQAEFDSDDSCVMGFPVDYRNIPVSCFQMDLRRAQEKYGVNTLGWDTLTASEDSGPDGDIDRYGKS